MIILREHYQPISALAFAPDGSVLASGSRDGALLLWRPPDPEPLRIIGLQPGRGCYDLAYHPSGNLLATTGFGLLLWDLATRTPTVLGRRFGIGPISFSPDGEFLLRPSWIPSPEIERYRVADGRRLPIPTGPAATQALALSPDGRRLACGHDSETVRVSLRDAESGEVITSQRGTGQRFGRLAFSPTGTLIAGVAGPRLHVWEVPSLEPIADKQVSRRHFQSLAFTPDGHYLATVSNDETVRFWDVETWAEAVTFTWKIGPMLQICFAPDGLRAAASSRKGRIVVWDVDL